ncbi:MAG: phage tail tube protein [Rhodospirillales bacterium]|nr:phage tail tube protein [Rhodospirillales bacterium]
MATKIAGVAFFNINGRQFDLRGDMTVSPDDIEREGVAGIDRVHGYIEKPRVPFMEGDFSDGRDVSFAELSRITDATVTIELANGKAYVFRNAWTASARELSVSDGKFKLRIEAKKCEEVR